MVGVNSKMLNLLLAIKHLPAFYAEHLPIALCFYCIEASDEGVPLS